MAGLTAAIVLLSTALAIMLLLYLIQRLGENQTAFLIDLRHTVSCIFMRLSKI